MTGWAGALEQPAVLAWMPDGVLRVTESFVQPREIDVAVSES